MNIYGQSIEDLEMFLESNGMKKFKAKQIYEWLYDKRISNFDDMRNISKETIDLLKINYNMDMLKLIKRLDDVDVSKFLFELFDGNRIEAVLMNHD